MLDAQQLADDYAALWNERDAAARRQAIARLWRPDGTHFVRTLEARGHEALEKRVTGSHDKNVRDGACLFRSVRNAQHTAGMVTFNWEMIRTGSQEVAAVGLEFLELDPEGRIRADYQFIVS